MPSFNLEPRWPWKTRCDTRATRRAAHARGRAGLRCPEGAREERGHEAAASADARVGGLHGARMRPGPRRHRRWQERTAHRARRGAARISPPYALHDTSGGQGFRVESGQSRSKQDQIWSNSAKAADQPNLTDSGQCWPISAEIDPKLGRSRHNLSNTCPTLNDSDQVCPESAQSGSNVVQAGLPRHRPKCARFWTNLSRLGRKRPGCGRGRPADVSGCRPQLLNIGQAWPRLGRSRPNLAVGPNSVEAGRNRPKMANFGQHRPKFSPCEPRWGPTRRVWGTDLVEVGQVWPTLAKSC